MGSLVVMDLVILVVMANLLVMELVILVVMDLVNLVVMVILVVSFVAVEHDCYESISGNNVSRQDSWYTLLSSPLLARG